MNHTFTSGSMIGSAIANGTALSQNIAPDTVTNLVNLIGQQAIELRSRTSGVASQVAGAIPAALPAQQPPTPDACLLDMLRVVSGTLSEALSEIERAQRSLAG